MANKGILRTESQNYQASCTWQRKGKPWPNHKHNHWYTDCGAHDYGKLARGLCPHCARPVQARTLEVGE